MGQQQLLLIVLGVIIVGIAVVVGINVFTASSLNANNDAVISDVMTIGSMAQQYYRKPAAMGGGGNSFVGFVVPPSLSTTPNMSAAIVPSVTATQVTLTATGTENNNLGAALSVVFDVWADSMKVTSTTVND
jgi:hypothetical protein